VRSSAPCWVAWAVGYCLGGPVNIPLGRIAWLALSAVILLAGRHTLRHSVRNPPFPISVPRRVGLLLAAAGVAWGTIFLAWSHFAAVRERQAALEAGDAVVVEGSITGVARTKQGTQVTVAGTAFRVGGASFGHLGRQVRLQPDLPVRITHREETILIFEADD
jgi:hypothetical protein